MELLKVRHSHILCTVKTKIELLFQPRGMPHTTVRECSHRVRASTTHLQTQSPKLCTELVPLGIRRQQRGTRSLPRGSLLAASGPFVFFFFFPTLVGTGGSYFFFLSLSFQKSRKKVTWKQCQNKNLFLWDYHLFPGGIISLIFQDAIKNSF